MDACWTTRTKSPSLRNNPWCPRTSPDPAQLSQQKRAQIRPVESIARVVLLSETRQLGSQNAKGGNYGDFSNRRYQLSQLAAHLSRLGLKDNLGDPMSNFFALRCELFEEVSNGLSKLSFKILLDILFTARRHWFTGLLSYAAACGVGVSSHIGLAFYLFNRHSGWFLSALAGVVVGVVWNYTVSGFYA